MSFAARARSARAANDTTREQINNIPSKSHFIVLLAELQRAKRASGAPWVRNFGKPMRPRKFGAYARTPSRTDSRGGGAESQGGPTGGGGGGGERQ